MHWFQRGVVVLIVIAACGVLRADSDWPSWRGPLQNGHATDTDLPIQWDQDSVVWKTSLPGRGQSSPIIFGDRLFLTTALDEGAQRVVFCMDRNDGRILWQQTAWTGEAERSHKLNRHASASCTTDGERVYAFFGKGGGLHCYTAGGEHVWSKGLGEFVITSGWGTAASPVLVGDMVIQNCDADTDAYLIALDKKTGETVWKIKRDDYRGWSTPVLITAGGRQELVLNGHLGVRSYDPATGREFWFCPAAKGRGTPMVTPHNGLLYVLSGLGGHGVSALRPGGEGDVAATHRVWLTMRKDRDVPSPIVVGGYCLIAGMRGGILTCYDAATGKESWQERLGGTFLSSPVAFRGHAFFLSEAGETVVIKPGASEHIVGRNTVGAGDEELFRASITASNGRLFLRSNRVLYCVGAGNAAGQ